MHVKCLMVALLAFGCASSHAATITVFDNQAGDLDLGNSANWIDDDLNRGTLPSALPGRIGQDAFGAATGPYATTWATRTWAANTSLELYGTSSLEMLEADSRSFRNTVNGSLTLNDSSVFTVTDGRDWVNVDIDITLNDDSTLTARRMEQLEGSYNQFGGTLDVDRMGGTVFNLYAGIVNHADDFTLSFSVAGDYLNFTAGSSASIVRSGNQISDFQTAVDADKIRIGGAVNTDGDYSAFNIVYDSDLNVTTMTIPEPMTLGLIGLASFGLLMVRRIVAL